MAGLLLALCLPGLAAADPPAEWRACQAGGDANSRYADVAGEGGAWQCNPRRWSIAAPVSYLRFEPSHAEAPSPNYLTTRLSRNEGLSLIVVGKSGQVRETPIETSAIVRSTSDFAMSFAVPRLDEPLRAVVLRVERPSGRMIFTDARLAQVLPGDAASDLRRELVFAWLCGLLTLPLLFNFVFFRVLRQSFVLWHGVAVVCILINTLVTTGIINRFARFDPLHLSQAATWSWAGAMACAGYFLAGLIEPGMLSRLQIRLLKGIALWVPGWTAFYFLGIEAIRPIASQLYYASFLPVLALLVWVMATAARRGSRAVRFQILAWLPMMLTGAGRVLTFLGVGGEPLDMMVAQHGSMAFEVIVTSFGVADRFLAMKRQRDSALAHTKVLESLADRDPLTGLYNRRAIETRFGSLLERGFDTMALLDLDHFKAINDSRGHMVGDSVLQTVAAALRPDADTIAVRIGGEEFLLLLRGDDALEKAEHRRRSIPARVAADVPGIDRIVTASMGLVTHKGGATGRTGFAELYGQCDRLLYEAKAEGRNRTRSETLTSFSAPLARLKAG